MKKVKSVLIAVVLLLILPLSALGCGEGGGQGGVYTLKVWAPSEEQQLLMSLRDSFFEDNPEFADVVRFDFEIMGATNVVSSVMLNAASAAAIFKFPAGAISELGENLMPITYSEVASRVRATHTASSITAVERNINGTSTLMAVPASPNNFVLHYNKSLLSETDVTSIESILSADTGAQYNLAMPLADAWYNKVFFLTAGATLFGADGSDPSSCTFNGAEGLQAAKYLMDLSMHDKFLNDSGGVGGSAFREGNLAAFFGPPISRNDVIGTGGISAENYGAVALPTINIMGADRQIKDFGEYQAYGLNAMMAQGRDTQNKIEIIRIATLFTEYISNDIAQMRRFEVNASAPTVTSLLALEQIKTNPAVVASIAQADINTLTFPTTPRISNFWDPMGGFGGAIAAQAATGTAFTEQQLQTRLDSLVQNITLSL